MQSGFGLVESGKISSREFFLKFENYECVEKFKIYYGGFFFKAFYIVEGLKKRSI